MSKTLYHSELNKMGQIEARVLSDVMTSKYQGKPPYVILEIDGNERLYPTENTFCANVLDGLKGRKVNLEARGSRGEATIRIETLDGAHEVTKSEPRHNSQGEVSGYVVGKPETYAEQQAREAKAFVDATRYAAKLNVLFAICYVHARLTFKAEDFQNLTEYEIEDLRIRNAQFLAIQSKDQIDVSALPGKWPDTNERKDEPDEDEMPGF